MFLLPLYPHPAVMLWHPVVHLCITPAKWKILNHWKQQQQPQNWHEQQVSFFSLCHRGNSFSLWGWRNWWGAVWGFESRLFCWRLFGVSCQTSGRRRRPGPRVCSSRCCGGRWRGLGSGFGEVNCHRLVYLVSHVENPFCCRMGRRKQRN